MCSKAEAREAHDARSGAIDRFAEMVDAMAPAPALSAATRAIGAVAEIYRGAAATVPLPGQSGDPARGAPARRRGR